QAPCGGVACCFFSSRRRHTRCYRDWSSDVCSSDLAAMYYMWLRYGKPDASMTGNGLLAGLVAITAPSGFVNPMAAVIIGLIAGRSEERRVGKGVRASGVP